MSWSDVRKVISTTIRVWRLDGAGRMGAALAFYLTMSVVPLAIICVRILGRVLGEQAVEGQLVVTLSTAISEQTARFIESMILDAARPGVGILTQVFGFITLLVIASNSFHFLRGSLDVIWGIRGRQSPMRHFIVARWLSFVLILGVQLIVLLLISAAATAMLALTQLENWFPIEIGGLTHFISYVTTYLGAFLLVAAVFRLLVREPLPWRAIWGGAAVTALLLVLGKIFMNLMLGLSNVFSLYGAFGSLLILLIWFLYIAQVFYMGAEFTKVYADRLAAMRRRDERRRRRESEPPLNGVPSPS